MPGGQKRPRAQADQQVASTSGAGNKEQAGQGDDGDGEPRQGPPPPVLLTSSQKMMQKLDMLRKTNSLDSGVSAKLNGLFSRKKNDSSRTKPGMGFELKGALQAAEKAVLTNHSQKFDESLDLRRADVGAQEPQGDASITQRGDEVEERVDRVHLLPIDWSLKEKAIFTSTLPFECFEASFNAPPEVSHQALRAFTSGNRRSRSPSQMYLQSLLTWTFPLIPLQRQSRQQLQEEEEKQKRILQQQKQTTTFSGKGIVMSAERRERYQVWREAFRDLMYSTYSGLCCAFYVLPPKGSSDRFVALFCCKSLQGRHKVSASFSHSSAGMRAMLKEDYGLTFSTPLMGKNKNKGTSSSSAMNHAAGGGGGDGAGREELEQDENAGAGEGLTNKEARPETMLYFSGKENVHGLYDFLMNECGKTYHKGCDTPILIAPVPFEGASVKRFHPEYKNYKQNLYKVNKKWVNGGDAGGNDKTQLEEMVGATSHFYQLHFTGHLLPPWVVDRLCTTFRKTQNGQFEAKFEPLDTTTKLNLSAVLLETEDEEYDSRMECHMHTGGFWDTEESEKWFTHPGKLNGKCIRRVTSNKGTYHITLK